MRTVLGIEALSDPLLLARRQNHRAILSSSYDRRGGNHDWSNYIRREGRQAVMMEAEGPGCITRIWTADPLRGTVRIFLDGQCAIETPFAKLFTVLPLTSGIGGESPEHYSLSKSGHHPMGFTTYCPIPFKAHCKITIEPEDDYLYYHVGAKLFTPGTSLPDFKVDTPEVRSASATLARWSQGLSPTTGSPSTSILIEPGHEAKLIDRAEAGVVTGLRISLPKGIEPGLLKHIRENLWLVAHFDDDEPRDPSIRAPIGAFFLDYGQQPRPRSLFIGVDEREEYYCSFAMPFKERARMTLVNDGILPAEVAVSLMVEKQPERNADLLGFRATWHTETPFGPDHRDYEGLACRLLNLSGHENMELLYVHGAGHFVGCGFSYDLTNSPTDRAAGESDEMFFIDDDPELTHYGTGMEDYTNDAWGMSGYGGPLAGDAKGQEGVADAHLFAYRMHLADPVPFVRKGRFTFEHGTGNNCSGELRSVAYWYMDPSLTRTRIEERRWEEIRTGKRKANEETS